MQRKLTISAEEASLRRTASRHRAPPHQPILSDLARPHVVEDAMEEGYRAMAADEEHEREATEWIEGLVLLGESD